MCYLRSWNGRAQCLQVQQESPVLALKQPEQLQHLQQGRAELALCMPATSLLLSDSVDMSRRYLACADLWLQCLTQMGLDSSPASDVQQTAYTAKELDDLLQSLQRSSQALGEQSQVSSESLSSRVAFPCPRENSDTTPVPDAQQQWKPQHTEHPHTVTPLETGDVLSAQHQTSPSSIRSTLADVWQQQAIAMPQLPFKPANQQHTFTDAMGQAAQLHHSTSAGPLWSPGMWLWGIEGALSRMQSLWQHFKHDTQMVSTQGWLAVDSTAHAGKLA